VSSFKPSHFQGQAFAIDLVITLRHTELALYYVKEWLDVQFNYLHVVAAYSLPYTSPSNGGYRLLFLDGHGSRTPIDFMWL
jgi:hypothetical protein